MIALPSRRKRPVGVTVAEIHVSVAPEKERDTKRKKEKERTKETKNYTGFNIRQNAHWRLSDNDSESDFVRRHTPVPVCTEDARRRWLF